MPVRGRRAARPAPTVRPSRPTKRPESYASYFTSSGRAVVPHGLRLQLDPDWHEEQALWRAGRRHVAGIDEVGRGCLAGPVVAGAVILPPGWYPPGLRDSKLLDADARQDLAAEIRDRAVAWSVGSVESSVIDAINILQATHLAATLAIARLPLRPDAVILDALYLGGVRAQQRSLVDADRLSVSVAAASVVAKVYRDRLMVEYERRYPGYGFASHKGYTCPKHRTAIEELGMSPIHRRTFGVCVDAREAESYPLWQEESG